jgi:hypothetical protein
LAASTASKSSHQTDGPAVHRTRQNGHAIDLACAVGHGFIRSRDTQPRGEEVRASEQGALFEREVAEQLAGSATRLLQPAGVLEGP